MTISGRSAAKHLAAAWLGFLTAQAVTAADPDADYYVYVSNEASNELSIIDPRSDEVVATIAVGRRPRGVRVGSDGRHVFIALSGSPRCPPTLPDEECERLEVDKTEDGIAIVDVAARRVIRVLPGGSDPEQFDLSRDERRLFVSNEDADAATIVDISTGRVLRTVPVGREPEGVKTSPDGTVFLVTSESDHDVTAVDAETGAIVARVEAGLRPRDVVFSRDGARAYVSAELERHVAVIDTESWFVLETIPLSATALPMGLAVSSDARWLYVANGRDRTVVKVNLDSRAVVASTEVGTRPWGLALSPDETLIYTANGPSNDVTVVDAASMSVVTRIAVGESPWGVTVGPRR
jgi:YVTN family beta-propeller protein